MISLSPVSDSQIATLSVQELRHVIKEQGLDLKVACVLGDDLIAQREEIAQQGHREMFSGELFPAVHLRHAEHELDKHAIGIACNQSNLFLAQAEEDREGSDGKGWGGDVRAFASRAHAYTTQTMTTQTSPKHPR